MKKKYWVFIIFLFSMYWACGQGYNNAVGLRAGWHSPGLEYRLYAGDLNSFKALLAARDRGIQLHGFAEFYQYDLFPFSQQLVFFYGFGAHLGFESWDVKREQNNETWYDTHHGFITGLDGLAGLEYVFYEVPLIAGFEVKPFFDVFGRKGFNIELYDIALTLKYIF